MGFRGSGPEAPCSGNQRWSPHSGGGLWIRSHCPQPSESAPTGKPPHPCISLPCLYLTLRESPTGPFSTSSAEALRESGQNRKVRPAQHGVTSDFHPCWSGWNLTIGKLCYKFLSSGELAEGSQTNISQSSTSFALFLGQSQVIAVDKEEAAVSLTRENAQRYMGWEVQRASTGELDFGT